jgi:tungstate transport system substrate-binding protein
MIQRMLLRLSILPLLACLSAQPARAQDFITLSSTTTTENSGLFTHILPQFTAQTGIEVRLVAQGTGQALETARRGDADVVLVHARAAEEAFVAEGYGVQRFEVMYNDFILVGPATDPAGLRAAPDAPAAMAAIAQAELPFISRGDDSGTHVKEQSLWAAAGIAPAGQWYKSTGSGMGTTLNMASELAAYTLTDRGTWLSFTKRGPLEVVFEGDTRLHNPYGIMLVNPARHPHVKAGQAQIFIDWILSEAGQAAIASFTINGEGLFFPAAQ